jgi:hypothetical protein
MAATRAVQKRKQPKPCSRCGCPPARAQYTEAQRRRFHWVCKTCRAAIAHERYLRTPKKLTEHEAEMLAIRARFLVSGVPLDGWS